MEKPGVLGTRARHSRLHDALCALDETHKIQTVQIPEDRKPQYYQKYAHMLAGRWGMKIHTRAIHGRGEPAYMIIVERRGKI
jgi:hypothetical protein